MIAGLLVALTLCAELPEARTRAQWEKERKQTLAGMQLVMGELPHRRSQPLRVVVLEEEKFLKFTRKKITYVSEADDRVPAYLFLPLGKKGRKAAMLCLHQTTRIGKGEPAGVGGKTDLQYARELAERGYVTLAPDYPNFGEYHVDAYAMGYASTTMKGIWNHMRAVDLLQSLPEVDPKRIGVIGHSLGGHNSLFLAAFDPRIRAIVTSCGFNSFAKYMKGDLTGWSHQGYMPRIASDYGKDPARMPFDFPGLLAALAPRPVFINAPLNDSNFEVSGVRDCVAAALPAYQLIFHANDRLVTTYPNTGHEMPPAVRIAAYEFLDHCLKNAAHR